MPLESRCLVFAVIAIATATVSCQARDAGPGASGAGAAGADDQARAEVTAAMARYQRAATMVNADSVAASFTTSGVLFEPGINPAQGRNAIRAFIASFPGVRVDSATAQADTIEVFGSTAMLWGSYFERLSFPGQPQSEQHGKFVAQWKRSSSGEWLIERLFRVPLPTPTSLTPPR